jgi:8-oxo-dGTP pyrophosphatase MutT (NUDIX family)
MDKARKPIEPKASLLVVHKGKILVSKANDGSFVRPPGGHIEYFEDSKMAVKREIMEEIRSGIENLKLEVVIENLFYFNKKRCHDLYFIYSGTLTNKRLYKIETIVGDENGTPKMFHWVKINDIKSGREHLVPKGLLKVVLKLQN